MYSGADSAQEQRGRPSGPSASPSLIGAAPYRLRAAMSSDSMSPDRNLALELVRVTEAAALGAARLVGMGDKEAADQAAVDGMHAVLHTIHMDGVVVIGEGEKDEAPMLHNGERVGDGTPP